MDLKELEGWEDDLGEHWYYASKAAALDKILKPIQFEIIVDVGAGSGFFARHLLARRSDTKQAICVDANYGHDYDDRVADKPIAYRRTAHTYGADLYLLMDVLEHVQSDVEFLESVVDVAPRGAHFLITVPAFSFLWSGHDEFLGHYRRYTLTEICKVARSARLTVHTSCYFFAAIFPAVAALRTVRRLLVTARSSDMRPCPRSLNRLARAVCELETWGFTSNRAFGLTAFVLASRTH